MAVGGWGLGEGPQPYQIQLADQGGFEGLWKDAVVVYGGLGLGVDLCGRAGSRPREVADGNDVVRVCMEEPFFVYLVWYAC